MFVSFNDENLRQRVDSVCRGFSTRKHWLYFQQLLLRPDVKSLCMLGVYFGRDIAYMNQIIKQLGRTDCTIVGVDLFADIPGADWPEAMRGKSWNEAGFGPAPTPAAAWANLQALGLADNVTLVQSAAEQFLATTDRTFDFIYIDVSHDFDTTVNTIDLGMARLSATGFLGGDDYSDEGTWGVKKAVSLRFPRHQVSGGWNWLAQRQDYLPPAK